MTEAQCTLPAEFRCISYYASCCCDLSSFTVEQRLAMWLGYLCLQHAPKSRESSSHDPHRKQSIVHGHMNRDVCHLIRTSSHRKPVYLNCLVPHQAPSSSIVRAMHYGSFRKASSSKIQRYRRIAAGRMPPGQLPVPQLV